MKCKPLLLDVWEIKIEVFSYWKILNSHSDYLYTQVNFWTDYSLKLSDKFGRCPGDAGHQWHSSDLLRITLLLWGDGDSSQTRPHLRDTVIILVAWLWSHYIAELFYSCPSMNKNDWFRNKGSRFRTTSEPPWKYYFTFLICNYEINRV